VGVPAVKRRGTLAASPEPSGLPGILPEPVRCDAGACCGGSGGALATRSERSELAVAASSELSEHASAALSERWESAPAASYRLR